MAFCRPRRRKRCRRRKSERRGGAVVIDKVPGIRPRESIWRRLDVAARTMFPTMTTLVMILLLNAPFGLPGQPQILASMMMASVYFWSLRRPASMPPIMVFLLGMLADLLQSGPFGVQIVSLLLVQGLAWRWRWDLTRHGGVMVWVGFMVAILPVVVLQYGLTAIFAARLMPLAPVALELGFAAVIYPLLAVFFRHAHDSGMAAPELA